MLSLPSILFIYRAHSNRILFSYANTATFITLGELLIILYSLGYLEFYSISLSKSLCFCNYLMFSSTLWKLVYFVLYGIFRVY